VLGAVRGALDVVGSDELHVLSRQIFGSAAALTDSLTDLEGAC
jgi:hypothetical protein